MTVSSKISIKQAAHLDNSLEGQLRRAIRAGRYVPGQRLVEADLMKHFEASQRQVRDALRRLEGEGVVSIEKNRGAIVREISRHEVSCILDVLDNLSLLAVRKVTENSNETEIRIVIQNSLKASQKFRKQAATEKKVHRYLDENVRFWDSIASAVNNPILWEIREKLETLLFRLQVQGLSINSDPEMWIAQHESILEAVLKKDVKRAEKLVSKSSAEIRKAILTLSDESFH